MVRVSSWFGPGSGIGVSTSVKSSGVGSPPGGVRASSHCLFMSVLLPTGVLLLSCSCDVGWIAAQAAVTPGVVRVLPQDLSSLIPPRVRILQTPSISPLIHHDEIALNKSNGCVVQHLCIGCVAQV